MDLSTLTEGQRSIVKNLDKPLFVAAGAGSGKTFTLTRRVIWALSAGSGKDGKPFLDSLDQVLVITFTNLAAQEIKERIRSALREEGLVEEALKVDNAWISTIHGMCSRMIKQHALELGVDPEFSVISELKADELKERALNEVLSEIKLDPHFRELINIFPLKRFGQQGVHLGEIVSQIMNRACSSVHGFEDFTLCVEGVNPYTLMHELYRSYLELAEKKIGKDEEQEVLERDVLRLEELINAYQPGNLPLEDALEVFAHITRPNGNKFRKAAIEARQARCQYNFVAAELSFSAVAPCQFLLMQLAQRVFERYQSFKRDLSDLDNDDLLRIAGELMQMPECARDYVNQFKLVMIDEFQDTNQQQVDMIELLSGKGAEHLCTVGDAQQSIYRFRGADVEVFERRAQSFGDDAIRLNTNFRSHDDILRFVAYLCGDAKLLDGFMDLSAGRKEEHTIYSDAPRIYVEETVSHRLGRKAPSSVDRVRTQAVQIASRLKEMADRGVAPGDMALLLGRMTYADLFVQEIRNQGIPCVVTGGSTFADASEVQIIKALLQTLANPKDTETGLFPVLTSEIFELNADDLCLLATKYEEDKCSSKTPIDFGFIDPHDAAEPSQRLKHARTLLQRAWETVGTRDIADVVLQVIRDSGWIQRLQKDQDEGLVRIANILMAIDHIRDIERENLAGAVATADLFCRWLDASKEHPAILMGDTVNAVRVMTVHASKGLEFPVVAVAEAMRDPRGASKDAMLMVAHDNSIVCSLKAPGSKIETSLREDSEEFSIPEESLTKTRFILEDMENYLAANEKARLLYVALTRARECLILGNDILMDSKEELTPAIGGAVAQQLVHELTYGVRKVDYKGSDFTIVRTVELTKASVDGVDKLNVGSEDLDIQMRISKILRLSEDQDESQQNIESCLFELYPQDAPAIGLVPFYKRKGIFSYSGVKDDIEAHEHDKAYKDDMPEDEGRFELKQNSSKTRKLSFASFALLDRDAEAPEIGTRDQGRSNAAVSLGSAFHEAAEALLFGDVSETMLSRLAQKWRCTRAQEKRLVKAFEVWETSAIRARALSFKHIIPEAPFFIEVDSRYGGYLEGAIDLLCYNELPGSVQVFDYKTGDGNKSLEEIYNSHELQAEFYAYVMFLQGATAVTCSFVCVEVLKDDGEPYVCEYVYDSLDELTRISEVFKS